MAAAFVAGTVAFFAPCCATVMLPTYLASITGGHRWHVLRLSAIYIAGVAVVVWPITIGVAAISSTIFQYHSLLFVGGGTMMFVVGILVLRGKMWSPALPQPRTGTDVASVFFMGVFAGAATACCAPVLAGVVALSALSGSTLGGAILGGAYLLGLVAPLLVAALLMQRYQRQLRDPMVTLRLGGRNLRIGLLRLIAGAAFVLIGIVVAILGLTGNVRAVPGFQRSFGTWIQAQLSWLADKTPDFVVLALFLVFLAFVIYRTVGRPRIKKRKEHEYGREEEVKSQ